MWWLLCEVAMSIYYVRCFCQLCEYSMSECRINLLWIDVCNASSFLTLNHTVQWVTWICYEPFSPAQVGTITMFCSAKCGYAFSLSSVYVGCSLSIGTPLEYLVSWTHLKNLVCWPTHLKECSSLDHPYQKMWKINQDLSKPKSPPWLFR